MFAMITKVLPFLAGGGSAAVIGKRWKEILIAVLLVVVGYQNLSGARWVLWADTIPYLRAELAKESVKLDIAEQANKTLVADIKQRNAEIERWSNVTDQLEQNRTELQAEISKIEIKANSRIRTVTTQVIPQECSGAMNYLFDSIPELEYNKLLKDAKDD